MSALTVIDRLVEVFKGASGNRDSLVLNVSAADSDAVSHIIVADNFDIGKGISLGAASKAREPWAMEGLLMPDRSMVRFLKVFPPQSGTPRHGFQDSQWH